MTIYDLIKDYSLPLVILKKAGYVSTSFARDIKIYEDYLNQHGGKIKRIEHVAVKYNLSVRSIQRIIKQLSKKA